MPWGTLIENYPFLENSSNHNPFPCWHKWNTFEPYSFFGQKWCEQPLNQKTTFPRAIPTRKMVLQSERSSMACVVARSRRIMRTKEEKNWLSCHALWKFDWVQTKIKKAKKKFSCKDSLFNLGNYVWDEKWQSFIILHWYRKIIHSHTFWAW